jgi:hypothetical protein
MSRAIARLPGECPLKEAPDGSPRRARRGGTGSCWAMAGFSLGREGLVFVDESGMHTSMDRLRSSRAPKGERAYYGKVPRNRGKNTTLIASMGLSGNGRVDGREGSQGRAGIRGPRGAFAGSDAP